MTVFAWILLYLVGIGYLPWENAVVALALWWFLTLPFNTWRDFNAAMNLDRVKKGCTVELPPEDERELEPDHVRVVGIVLWLPGAFKNWFFNHTWGTLYFLKLGKPKDRGFTDRINRLSNDESDPKLAAKARAVAKRWLHRFDRRGRHT